MVLLLLIFSDWVQLVPLVLLSGFVLGRDQVSIRDHAVTLDACVVTAGKTRDANNRRNNNDDLLTTTNEAYGIHVSMGHQKVTTSSVAPVYESVDTI